MRSRLIKAALLAISVSLTFAIIEIGMRIVGAYPPIDEPIRPPQPELYQADANVGYRIWPSRTTTYRYPQTSTEELAVVSNSDGFRNSREFDEPDQRRRILVVGDSFVFGQGVRQQDRLTEQLERLEPQWRVDNMGMTGWGIDLMVRAIERYGTKARPDVVVLAVYTDDFRRLMRFYAGAGYAYPKFELQKSRLVTVPFKYPRAWERLRTVQFVYQAVLNNRRNRARNRYDLNEALLDRFLVDSKTIGFKPLVVFLPGKNNNKEDQERRVFLKEWATRNGVAFGDLTATIHAQKREDIYIADNSHWNVKGHQIAAEQLRNLLQQMPGIPGAHADAQ